MSNIPNLSKRIDDANSSLTSINTKIPSLSLDGPALSVAVANWPYSNGVYRNISLATTSGQILANSGYIHKIFYANLSGATIAYLKFYNKTTATSSDTPIITLPIPPQSGGTYDLNYDVQSGGFCVRATTGLPDNDNTGPSANEIIVNITYD